MLLVVGSSGLDSNGLKTLATGFGLAFVYTSYDRMKKKKKFLTTVHFQFKEPVIQNEFYWTGV